MPDFSRVPIACLSLESRHLLANCLNPPKVLPASNGSLRDWRGLAKIFSIESEYIPALVSDADPFNSILSILERKSPHLTLKNLIVAFEDIDRWDVIDDSQVYLTRDADAYLTDLERPATVNNFAAEQKVLTLDDQVRVQQGLELQHYDAFVLHDDRDSVLVDEIVKNLEEKNNMKLCMKDRDLVVGIRIEQKAIVDLIYERCNRIIVIISPHLFQDPSNQFFINFAQATATKKKQERKIIPCICEECEIPPEIEFVSKLNYKTLKPEYFWNRLILSVQAVPDKATKQKPISQSKEARSLKNSNHNNATKSSTDISVKTPLTTSKDSNGISKQCSKAISSDNDTLPKQQVRDLSHKLPSIDDLPSLSSETQPKLKSSKKSNKKSYFRKPLALLSKLK
ncbi:hypothetical protein QAD02_022461 [Eretmocerus hayati]|uniref:Uncharacterized protein n=1 Tax=Eretmocerus hayati TaxID=131215 RepID=A0ACC2PWD5_9HYME|nr:hypothetical protein QAD02_022461 [Eretmocerus hayati]